VAEVAAAAQSFAQALLAFGVDSSAEARVRARELLLSILSPQERHEMETSGVVRIRGKVYSYVLLPYAQTEIRKNGRSIAWSCLQLSIPAPADDRMIAEYLILKNDEALYWRKANVLYRSGEEFGIGVLFLIAFDVALLTNLLAEVFRII